MLSSTCMPPGVGSLVAELANENAEPRHDSISGTMIEQTGPEVETLTNRITMRLERRGGIQRHC
jgi:hypothetical protein